MALRRQLALEKMEEDQKDLHIEMLVELVQYVRHMRAARAKAARDSEQASRDKAFLENMRKKKAEQRATAQ